MYDSRNPGSRGRGSAALIFSLALVGLWLSAASCDSSGVSLKVIDPAELKSIIAKRAGKVVLVDYWATWCPPCVKEFPHTVEIWKKFGPKGLEVISMSLDDPKQEKKALEFLTKHGAAFSNYLSREGGGTTSMEALDIEGVPRYRVYDRKGTLRGDFRSDPAAERQYQPEDIEAEVQKVLAER